MDDDSNWIYQQVAADNRWRAYEIKRTLEAEQEVDRERVRAELRDRFAMAALTGLLAGRPIAIGQPEPDAALAYQIADAMLKAREVKS